MQVSIQPKARSLLRALPKIEGMETVEGKKSMGGQLCVSNTIVVVGVCSGVLKAFWGFLGVTVRQWMGNSHAGRYFPESFFFLFERYLAGCDGTFQ